MSRFRQAGDLLKNAASEWSNDNASQLSAALSYYTVFSLAPLLLIVVIAAGLAWGGQPSEAQAHIIAQIQDVVGPDAAEMVGTMLENVTERGAGGGFAAVVGIIGLLFGATGVFAQLQTSLNQIWNVSPDPDAGFMGMVVTRLLSFGMILVIGFLLLISLVLSAGIAALEGAVLEYLPGTAVMVGAIDLTVSLAVITVLFAMIYQYLPDVEIAWSDVWIGAGITALLFVLGKFALGIYLGNSDLTSTFGAAGSLVVLLVWVYYSSLIFFFGAEITQVYAERYGTAIAPSEAPVADVSVSNTRTDATASGGAIIRTQAATTEEASRSPWKTAALLGTAFLVGRWWGGR